MGKEEKKENKESVEALMKEVEELKKLLEKQREEEERKKKEDMERKAREKFTEEIKHRLRLSKTPEHLEKMSVPELRRFAKNMEALNVQMRKPGPLMKFEDRLGKYGLPVLLIAITALTGLIIMAVA